MYDIKIKNILENIKSGDIDVNEAYSKLKDLPYEDIGYANIDHHREVRTGYPEVIYCEGKAIMHLVGIVEAMLKKDVNILATRASKEVYDAVKDLHDDIFFDENSGILILKKHEFKKSKCKVLIATGGTSDIAVAEEAALTAECLGTSVIRLYDVGVAGIHRLLSRKHIIDEASVIIAVAGMEGALASVIGGLVDVPVIAVPTSIGYGAHFNGLASLLAMLNSCASGIGVVNIDNGFGAGYLASSIVRQIEKGDNNE